MNHSRNAVSPTPRSKVSHVHQILLSSLLDDHITYRFFASRNCGKTRAARESGGHARVVQGRRL